MITTIDKEIIEKLSIGQSPAEISIAYKNEGKDIPSSYVRHIKMLWKANLLELLEVDETVDAEEKAVNTITTSKQYAEFRKQSQ